MTGGGKGPSPGQQPQGGDRPDPLELLFLLEHVDLEGQEDTAQISRDRQA